MVSNLCYRLPSGPRLGSPGELPLTARSLGQHFLSNVMVHILTRPAKVETPNKRKTIQDDLPIVSTGPLGSPVRNGRCRWTHTSGPAVAVSAENLCERTLSLSSGYLSSGARRMLGAGGSTMLAIAMDPADVEPDELTVPTLATTAKDFSYDRDQKRCFPVEEQRAIGIETAKGLDSADRAMDLLGLKGRNLGEIRFMNLISAFKRTRKMNGNRETPVDDRSLVRAYNFISGHIKAIHFAEYETARVARKAAHQEQVERYGTDPTAPGGEDPRDPVVPLIPIVIKGDGC